MLWAALLLVAGCSGAGPAPPSAGDAGRDAPAAEDAAPQPDRSDAEAGPAADAGLPPDAGPPPCACPHGPCVRREKDPPEPACAPPCAADRTCPASSVCVEFPGGPRCLPAGDRSDGQYCNAPAECAGGLCVWAGGGPALCTSACAGPDDLACGAGRACLPALVPAGAWHCYRAGALETGADCLGHEGECSGGYCLGQGVASFCSRVCRPDDPQACPRGWSCAPYDDGFLCCDPTRSRGGC